MAQSHSSSLAQPPISSAQPHISSAPSPSSLARPHGKSQSNSDQGSSRSVEGNDSRPAIGYHVPGMDFQDLVKAQRRNIDVLVEAHMIAAQGAHNIARRQAEITRETFDRIASLVTTTMETDNLLSTTLANPKAIQEGFERALGHMKELMKTMNETNMSVFQIMNGRIAELFDRTEKTEK